MNKLLGLDFTGSAPDLPPVAEGSHGLETPETTPAKQRGSNVSTVSQQSTMFQQSDAKMTVLMAMFIYQNAIPFRQAEDHAFQAMIMHARNISSDFKFPGREKIRGPLLTACHDRHMLTVKEKLLNEAHIYGNHAQGDGANIGVPLVNVLMGGVHLPVAVVKILDCRDHMLGGNKKDASFLAKEFIGPMLDLDPKKEYFDLQIFDGASVCKKAQRIMSVQWPRLTCITGAEHTLHNIFKGIGKLSEISVIIKQDKVSKHWFFWIP